MKRLVPARVVVSVFLAAFAIIAILALASSTASAAAPAFKVGTQVATTLTTNVRATADGTLIGTQPRDAIGNITAGPVAVGENAVIWYQVSFVTGPSGWVGGDMLIGGIASPNATVAGNRGTAQTMVLDEFGGIEVGFISFDANNNPTYSYSESTNQGLTFSAPTVLPMSAKLRIPDPPTGPVIASERNGAIDVAYACLGTDCPGHFGNQSVQLIRSINHGATWSAPVQLSLPTHPGGFGAQEPVIAACGAGVTVAWQDDGIGSDFTSQNPDIFVVHVLDGVPGKPVNVSNTLASEGHPQISVNPQGTVYLTWVTDNQNGPNSPNYTSVVFAAIPNCAAVPK